MRTIATRWVVLAVLGLALVLAGGVSYYASHQPDGLTKVSQDQGFSDTAKAHHASRGPLAGYRAKDVGDRRLSGALAGIVGVVVVLTLGTGLAYVVRRRDHEPAA